jgi:hypothetical protein
MTFEPNLTQRIVAKAKRRVIPNWKTRLKDYSTIALGLTTMVSSAMLAAWAVIPLEWKAALPKDAILYLASVYMVLGTFGGIGKFLTQPGGEK